MSQEIILDILTNKKLHLQLIGQLPEEYKNDATHNHSCFIGGSYALYVASKVLGIHWNELTYNDIDVYICREKDHIKGYRYQNILLDTSDFKMIDIKTASLIIHMYDLECCQFLIYNGMIFGTNEAIKALETKNFTVKKEFMGCYQTVKRVHKYRMRGFNIVTPKPNKIICLNYYGTQNNVEGNIIYYPRSIVETLYQVFGIENNKPIKHNVLDEFVKPKLDSNVLNKYRTAKLVRDNMQYVSTGGENNWNIVKDGPILHEGYFRMTELHITNNIITMEFVCHNLCVTYVIDKKDNKCHYTMNEIVDELKPHNILFYNDILPFLGIVFMNNGLYIRK